jgi:dihydrofolate reductase
MNISIVASIGKNNELGINNKLLWHLSDDLKNFKEITTGHTIVMGEKTYESIGKPLPNRRNIIITRIKDYEKAGCEVAHSPEDVLKLTENDNEIFIIGGGQIYKLFLPIANKLYLTEVDTSLEADTFFPKFNQDDWNLVSSTHHPKDERNEYSFSFNVYEKDKSK